MKGLAWCLALTVFVGCGTDPGIPNLPGNPNPDPDVDGGTSPMPPSDPEPDLETTEPVHNGPNDVTIPVNENRELVVGGVKFIIARTDETNGIITATNNNSNSVRLVVDYVDGKGGVIFDEKFLDSGESVSNHAVDLSPGVNIRFSVKVWKSGIDFLTCAFSDTCYSSSDKDTYTFYEE